ALLEGKHNQEWDEDEQDGQRGCIDPSFGKMTRAVDGAEEGERGPGEKKNRQASKVISQTVGFKLVGGVSRHFSEKSFPRAGDGETNIDEPGAGDDHRDEQCKQKPCRYAGRVSCPFPLR